MDNKIDIDNIIKKYISDNDLVIIQHNCVYMKYKTFKVLRKTFGKNIDIKKLYQVGYFCTYSNTVMHIMYNNSVFLVKKEYVYKHNVENFFIIDSFSWVPETTIVTKGLMDIYNFFIIHIVPKMVEIRDIGDVVYYEE